MQAFSNIRVLDLTHIIAGPFCTYQLGVMGADVIKIENTGLGDSLREEGGDLDDCKHKMGSAYLTQSANKRSLAIDLKSKEGKVILTKLIETADVLVENFRAGAMQQLGFGYDEVREIKPDIIYCSLTGFGQEGPLSDRTAYDNVIQAMSGLMATTGAPESGAVKVGPPVLDYGTGIQAAFAIATALYQRTATGEGQFIDISMLDAAIMLSGTNFTMLQSSGKVPNLVGNSSESLAGYGCFNTKQGQLMVGAYTVEQYSNLWVALGDKKHAENLRGRPLYEMNQYVIDDKERLSKLFLCKTADEWELFLNQHKVPAGRVRNADETFSHPQMQHRSVFQEIDVNGAPMKLTASAFKFKSNGPSINTAPPQFGEHTKEVLTSLGYSDKKMKELLRKQVVKTT